MTRQFHCTLTTAIVVALLGGCATSKVVVPAPVPREADAARPQQANLLEGTEGQSRPQTLQSHPTPLPPGTDSASVVAGMRDTLPPLKGGAINVNIEGMPIPAFINEFFGTILGTGFQMRPEVARMNDLITLRTPGPQSPENFYRLARQVLAGYGVGAEYSGGMVFFTRSEGGLTLPVIVSGRTLPNIPVSHRPVFQVVELQAVRATDVSLMLRAAFKTDALSVQEVTQRNALILIGKPELVRQALEAVQVFDRPAMRGRSSARLEPAFVSADELAKRLVEVLNAEGYAAVQGAGTGGTAGAILVLPVAAANTVLVFAGDRAVLAHVVEWARTIDRPNPTAGSDGLYYYTVRNTLANELVATITGIQSRSNVRTPARETVDSFSDGGRMTSLTPLAQGVVTPATTGPATTGDTATQGTGGMLQGAQLMVDKPRNAIIFQGKATDWARILPLIQQMDRAPRQVMIEVTVAEVSLNSDDTFGVAWFANNDIGKFDGTLGSGTLENSTKGVGLRYLFDLGGVTRLSLKAIAKNKKMTILSTPRMLVKSGEEANIDVGQEVPTVSSQAVSPISTGGNSNMFQTVQYRKTGMLLNIKPVVFSDDRVDLEIRQEVSEVSPDNTGIGGAPAIYNRSYSTSLSLKDGRGVMLGGLIDRTRSQTSEGVPYLKDVPVVGNLFKSRGDGGKRTELILMITPYIVESDSEMDELTQAMRQRFELIDIPVAAPAGPAIQPSQPVSLPPPPVPQPRKR